MKKIAVISIAASIVLLLCIGQLQAATAIWKGDNPTKEQIAKMDKEELAQRASMQMVETIRKIKFKSMVKSKALGIDEYAEVFAKISKSKNLPGGFYNPQDKTVYICTKTNASNVPNVRIYCNTQALQDQYWKPGNPKTVEEYNVLRGLTEGERLLVTFDYMNRQRKSYAKLNDRGIQVLMKKRLDSFTPKWREDKSNATQYNNTVEGASYKERLSFESFCAARFIHYIAVFKGWENISVIYGDKAPISTEQIMHPEKYFRKDMWDEPTDLVEFPNIPKALGKKWKYTGQMGADMTYNTMGEKEFFLRYLMSSETGMEAEAVAAGWDGDWYATIHDGKEGCEIWLTAWDSPNDAKHWLSAQTKYFNSVNIPRYTKKAGKLEKTDMPDKLTPVFKEVSEGKTEATLYKYDGGYVYFEIFENFVLFVETSEISTMAGILDSFKGKIHKDVVTTKLAENKRNANRPASPTSWVDAWKWINMGQFLKAEEFVKTDKHSMSKTIYERIQEVKKLHKLCGEGKFDEARKILAVFRDKGRYVGMVKYIERQMKICEEGGTWELK